MNKRFDEDIWIIEKLAVSGSYDLYLALWPEVGEKVLIKHVSPHLSEDKKVQTEERLLKEAATLEEFWSPYFPKIYDIRKKQDDDSLYIISQYFEGITLKEMFDLHREDGLPKEFVSRLEEELNFALNYLHNKKGVAHLDISPDNIIVSPEKNIHIIDFENSKLLGTPMEREELRGKKDYLAPELLEERENLIIKKDFDLYSLKVILKEAKKLVKKKSPRTAILLASPLILLLISFLLVSKDQKQTNKRVPTKEQVVQKVVTKQAAPKRVKVISRKPGISYEDQFEKLTQARYIDAKECLRLFGGTEVKTIELKVFLKGKKGTPKATKLSYPRNLNSNTKICLESLFSDIQFPATKRQREKVLIKRFKL